MIVYRTSIFFRQFVAFGVVICFVSCANDHKLSTASTDRVTSTSAEVVTSKFPALIDDRLGQAAERNAAALETLAMIERTRTPPSPVRVDEALLNPELLQPITIGWFGPATEAVRRIAETVGYRYVETGARPAAPVLIALDARERAAGQVLSDIGLRVQGSGAVIVNQRARLVEYRHGVIEGAAQRSRQVSTVSTPRSSSPAPSSGRVSPATGNNANRPAHCPPCEGAVQASDGAR